MRVACIGSRDLTPEQTDICERLGQWLVSHGHIISTGNAEGADQAFARGGNSVDPTKVHLWLPWYRYERQAIVPGNQVVLFTALSDQLQTLLLTLAEKFHPAWGKLTQGGQKLQGRNGLIILDRIPEPTELLFPKIELMTDRVLALPSSRPGGGGTGQGMRMAQNYGIPVTNLRDMSRAQLRSLCEEFRR